MYIPKVVNYFGNLINSLFSHEKLLHLNSNTSQVYSSNLYKKISYK